MRIAITMCALLAMVATAGCGGGQKTTTVGGTSVTTSDDNKTTTVSANGGSMTVGSNAIDPSKLGAPLYPGATQDGDGGSMTLTTAEATNSTATLHSTDSFDKVYDYYKAQLPSGSEKLKMSSGGSSTAMFQIGDSGSKEMVLVTLSAKDGDPTTITINHSVKSDSAMASAAPSTAPSPGPSASSDGGC